MKIPFSDYKKIQRMNYNQLNNTLIQIYMDGKADGIKEAEKQLDNATVDQWQAFIDNTPGTDDLFSVWHYEELEKKLAKSFSRDNVIRIMEIITGGEENE